MFWDVIRYVKKPVIASHSSARELANVPRNMSDAMLRAVGKNGGAVCVNFYPGFLDTRYGRAAKPLWEKVKGMPLMKAQRILQEEQKSIPPVPLARLIDHLEHVIEVAGIDHVCLGSDFDGITALPAGLDDVSKLPAVTVELRRRGHSPADVEKLLGGNVLRVMHANEAP
jgi:membrane dipeptidase